MITVVGSYNQDLFFTTASFPGSGETVMGELRSAPGGKGFNQAVAAARMDAEVHMIGALGADAMADQARTMQHDAGITGHWQICEIFPTGSACILLESDGANRIIVAPGANAELTETHINECAPVLKASNVILAQGEVNPAAVERAFALGRAALRILNPAPVGEWMTDLLKQVDLLTPNETELSALLAAGGIVVAAEDLAGLPAADLAHYCARLGPPRVIVSLGAAGCFIYDSLAQEAADQACFASAPTLTAPVVDTTGAGDCLNGALAAGLDAGLPLQSAIRQAVRAASLSVTRPGAAPSMPYSGEI